VALIAVMMVVAFVVLIAVSMSGRLQLELQRQINLQQRQQAIWLALGAEQFIQRLLKKSAAGKETTNLSQEWATQGAVFPVEQATISGTVTDLQACFNLNALLPAANNNPGTNPDNNADNNTANDTGDRDNPNNSTGRDGATPNNSNPANSANRTKPGQQTPAQQAFLRLLEQNALELSMPPDYLVARVTDWLDPDSTLQSAGGAEENDYAALEMPYYSANSLMVSKSELRVILDMTPADYALVAPLVCVIPQVSSLKINVNTMTEQQAPVLAALIPGLSEDDAKSVISGRPEKGYDSVDDFFSSNSAVFSQTPTAEVKALFDVKSAYFQAEISIDTADSNFSMTSLLKLDDEQVQVVARRFGGPG
jgi:general secretion pathway protein K